MTTDYRYQLETPRLTGRRQEKVTCPQCGRRSLVRYVDTHNQFCYVAGMVGKCDHEHSCGYHYKPSEYFRDNAWLKEKPSQHRAQEPPKPKPAPPLQPLPLELVEQYHSSNSTFWRWFRGECAEKLELDAAVIERIYEDYLIGDDGQGNVIFWQIDEQGRLRSGKIMSYGTDGHRIGNPNWVHSKLLEGKLPKDWALCQCLFGAHLLAKNPDKQVCLVESEKTAIVMAAHQPEYLWLATGGSGGLSQEKLNCLKGRRVTVFPDSGCYGKWLEKLKLVTDLNYTITDALETYPSNTDLCDVLLGEAEHPP